MTGNEIITLLSNNLPTILSPVKSLVGELITLIFLRRKKSSEEFEKIKAGMFKDVVESLLKSGRMTYVEFYQSNNFLAVAEKADKYYSDMHHNNVNTDTNYDLDWFVRMYEAVGNVSDEKMQDLWAKLLAAEVSNPSSYSLKTIDVLRNMSKKDAELFEVICSHSFKNKSQRPVLPRYDGYLEKYNILYMDIMKLNEQGLIYSESTLGQKIHISGERKILFWDNNTVITIESLDGNDSEVRISEYPFTQVGHELSKLVSRGPSEEKYIEFAKQLSDQYKNHSLGVYRVLALNETKIEYDDKNLLDSVFWSKENNDK